MRMIGLSPVTRGKAVGDDGIEVLASQDRGVSPGGERAGGSLYVLLLVESKSRSEERRVGKECVP